MGLHLILLNLWLILLNFWLILKAYFFVPVYVPVPEGAGAEVITNLTTI